MNLIGRSTPEKQTAIYQRCVQEEFRRHLATYLRELGRDGEMRLDWAVLQTLIRGFDDLLLGHTPLVFRKASKAKGATRNADLEEAKIAALVYIEWSKRRLIRDPHPVLTITREFDVTPALIRYWRRQLGKRASDKARKPSKYKVGYLESFLWKSAEAYLANRKITKTKYLEVRKGKRSRISFSFFGALTLDSTCDNKGCRSHKRVKLMSHSEACEPLTTNSFPAIGLEELLTFSYPPRELLLDPWLPSRCFR